MFVCIAITSLHGFLSPWSNLCKSVSPIGHTPTHLLVSVWEEITFETKSISQRCPRFLQYSVSVIGARAEPHHIQKNLDEIPHPSMTEHCAVLLVLETSAEDEESDQDSSISRVRKSMHRGWTVISFSRSFPAIQARRVSRVPKLLPHLYFPFTLRVLYSDLKLLGAIKNIPSESITNRLLSEGAHFGIVQHPLSQTVMKERDLILQAKQVRPMILANEQSLKTQVELIELMLTDDELRSFGVEGQIFARIIHSDISSSMFDMTWFEEYMMGSDRDQIAFYAAASRMRMKRTKEFTCDRFRRSGQYHSGVIQGFTMNIHCDLKEIIKPLAKS